MLQDIEKIGKKYDVKDVADGYARNFLLAKNLAKAATEEMLEWVKVQKEILEKKAEENLKESQGLASSLDGQEVILDVKIGPEGQLFESITGQKIVEKLKEMGFTVKKSQIDLPEPIRETGEFPVKVKLEHNLEAEIQIIITGQAAAKEEE